VCRRAVKIEEAATSISLKGKVDLAINVIVDNQGKVIYMNAGAPVASHVEGVHFYNDIYQFSLDERQRQSVDIVIAGSPLLRTIFLFIRAGLLQIANLRCEWRKHD
jgi:hypothetical protein